jgi:hypothetical protein
VSQPTLTPLVHSVHGWLDQWISGITSNPPTFDDVWASQANPESRLFITSRLRNQVSQVVAIVDREQAARERIEQQTAKRAPLIAQHTEDAGVVAALERQYVGPGTERADGPRNDNDFAEISQIRIAPTHQELICPHKPFLPANIPNAPHHLPAGSMERLLDIQFRLLREELM